MFLVLLATGVRLHWYQEFPKHPHVILENSAGIWRPDAKQSPDPRLFHSGSHAHTPANGSSSLSRAIYFTKPTNQMFSSRNIFTDTQKQCVMWPPHGSVKLIHKINHHNSKKIIEEFELYATLEREENSTLHCIQHPLLKQAWTWRLLTRALSSCLPQTIWNS